MIVTQQVLGIWKHYTAEKISDENCDAEDNNNDADHCSTCKGCERMPEMRNNLMTTVGSRTISRTNNKTTPRSAAPESTD
ncbi:hypothetical protein WN51_10320 [Melipona quadrifasciata]|uniref:Uncharacterized protein n=1 Tax=Melipona quadrifasciata TaxID=166423 RepID=A0A0M8ZPP3_9HYME|nr:hypothetical protein WN51_10320 [Melipona quadrifasciata]